jgi:hypothetical protein
MSNFVAHFTGVACTVATLVATANEFDGVFLPQYIGWCLALAAVNSGIKYFNKFNYPVGQRAGDLARDYVSSLISAGLSTSLMVYGVVQTSTTSFTGPLDYHDPCNFYLIQASLCLCAAFAGDVFRIENIRFFLSVHHALCTGCILYVFSYLQYASAACLIFGFVLECGSFIFNLKYLQVIGNTTAKYVGSVIGILALAVAYWPLTSDMPIQEKIAFSSILAPLVLARWALRFDFVFVENLL